MLKLGDVTGILAKKHALRTGAAKHVWCNAAAEPWGDLTGTSGNSKSLFPTSSFSLSMYMTHVT